MTEAYRKPSAIGSIVLTETGCAVGALVARQLRLTAAALKVPAPQPAFHSRPRALRARLLVVGDSTGVGDGERHAAHSLAGLMATEFTALETADTAGCAANVGDTLGQVSPMVSSRERFDVARLFAGGNDVLCFTDLQALRQAATHALIALKGVARCVLWIADRPAPYFASDG